MNLIICIIGPAFISIKLFDYLNNNKLSIKDTLIFFGIFVLEINFFSTIFSAFLFDIGSSIDKSLIDFPGFAIKYLFVATIIAIMIPYVLIIFRRNIKIGIEVKKIRNEKKSN